jgi:hypothetical protein
VPFVPLLCVPPAPPVPCVPLLIVPPPPVPLDPKTTPLEELWAAELLASITQSPAMHAWPAGQTAPMQSSTHAPATQCVEPVHVTPTHFGSMQSPLVMSQDEPDGHGRHAHDEMQMPPLHTSPEGQVTPEHGSTQAPTRQTWG